MSLLDKQYWDHRYLMNEMGWDIGYPSTPLKSYIDQLNDKNLRILVPGAGNAYEVEHLFRQGFLNTFMLDWSEMAIANFKKRMPGFPDGQLLREDFFEHKGQYGLILEQTFFSALHPNQRKGYARHMQRLLQPVGRLVGVLFDDPLFQDHPPFGGNKDEYLPVFKPYFEIEKFETCYNSIPERQGRELFISLKAKKA